MNPCEPLQWREIDDHMSNPCEPHHDCLRGGLPTVYQAVFWVAREELNVVPDLSIAQATERFRSATERSALP